jgi:hypothetical protein
VNRILVAFLLFTLATGCTIEKRMHTGGYYIQWHKRHRHPDAEKEKPRLAEEPAEDEKTEDTLTETIEEVTEVAVDSVTVDSVAHRPDAEVTDLTREKRRFEPLGVLSVKLLVADFLIALLKDHAEAPEQDLLLGIALLAVLILALVLGIVSMVRYLRNPKAYKFNIWAILAIPAALFFLVVYIMDYLALY